MITFTCPRCQHRFTSSDAQAGEKFSCTECGQRVRVPSPPAAHVVEPLVRPPMPFWMKGIVASCLFMVGLGGMFFWIATRPRDTGKPDDYAVKDETVPKEFPLFHEMKPVTDQPVAAQLGNSASTALSRQVHQLLAKHCHRCHGENGAAEGGLNFIMDLDRLKERKLVVAGSPENSRLFHRVHKKEMPPDDAKTRPSLEELGILRQWIEIGAPTLPNPPQPMAFISFGAEVDFIHGNVSGLPERDRRFARYFSITNLANAGLFGDELETYRVALAKLLNSLSWNADIILPVPVDPQRLIFRIDIRDYMWTDRTWKRLLEEYPFGVLADGSRIAQCVQMTGGQFPVLRSDWFVAHASRPPLYHEILQIPENERKLEEHLRIDVAENIRQERIVRAGFNGSGVSRNNRLIERHTTPYGAYWRSYDFESNEGPRNVFAFPLGPDNLGKTFAPSGGEVIFNLPNGLHGFMLVNKKGNRLDKAPQQIVSDPRRPDRAVENGVSCMSCHTRGLIPKKDQVRPHVEKNPASFATAELDTIKALYPREEKLAHWFERDNERFRRSMSKIGPLTSTEPITTLVANFEKNLDLKMAAAELGLRPAQLSEYLGKSPNLLRVLGPLRLADGTVQRQVFTGAIPEMANEWKLGAMMVAGP